jgi:hypothetical protein
MQDNVRLQEIAKTVSTDEDRAALRRHLRLIVEGEAFKGSRRSAQFLLYVVERSLNQQLDALKERTIGIELFGRTPAYDTGEDAIVRVTASDVRRRLLQHYGRAGQDTEFRIGLPPGGYIPEIHRDLGQRRPDDAVAAESLHPSSGHEEKPVFTVSTAHEVHVDAAGVGHIPATHSLRWSFRWPRQLAILAALAIVVALVLWWRHSPVLARSTHASETSPWSPILHSAQPIQVIASDPDIAEVQTIADKQLSLSDYANENYGCEFLAPNMKAACQSELVGDKVAAIDAEIVARIAVLAERNQSEIVVRSARGVRLRELRTDDNYILLGSPRSNPWVGLYSDQMEYQILYDPVQRQEIVRNKRPQAGESDQYIPTAKGFGTGQSFATVSLLRNPDQKGRIFLLAGTTAESTHAASEFATNIPVFAATLKNCGIAPTTSSNYQILLRVETMAGSATQTDVVGCHKLSP